MSLFSSLNPGISDTSSRISCAEAHGWQKCFVFCDEAIDLFVARDLVKTEQHLDADESIDVEEWEVKDLLELIYGGKLTDGKTVAAIMAYAQREGIR